MNQDTTDFLATLLTLADDSYREDGDEKLTDKRVCDFSAPFVDAVEAFIAAFRAHLERSGFPLARLADLERSFGGNVYLSLSGHGAGFFDDRDEQLSLLHDMIKAWAGGNRFEELECMLDVGDDGKIDLAIVPEHIDEYRAAMFRV